MEGTDQENGQANEKMLIITNYQRNTNQNHNEVPPSHQSERPSSKSLQTINAGEGVEKREHSCTLGGNVNGTVTMENSMEAPLKVKNRAMI